MPVRKMTLTQFSNQYAHTRGYLVFSKTMSMYMMCMLLLIFPYKYYLGMESVIASRRDMFELKHGFGTGYLYRFDPVSQFIIDCSYGQLLLPFVLAVVVLVSISVSKIFAHLIKSKSV